MSDKVILLTPMAAKTRAKVSIICTGFFNGFSLTVSISLGDS